MKTLMIITISAVFFFGVGCAKDENTLDNPESVNEESKTDNSSGELEEKPPEEEPILICLAEKLNIRTGPGSTFKIIRAISRDEQVYLIEVDDENFENLPGYWHRGSYISLDDPSGYADWTKIRMTDGTEGWVARMFVINYEAYKQLEEIDRAAKTGDSAKTEAVIKRFTSEADETDDISGRGYSRSPNGEMFAITDGYGGNGGFMVTVNYGVSSYAPLRKHG